MTLDGVRKAHWKVGPALRAGLRLGVPAVESRPARRASPTLVAALLVFMLAAMNSGCSRNSADTPHSHKHAEDEHRHAKAGEHEHGAEHPEVGFKAGRGLSLSPEVVAALGLKTVEAEERPLSSEVKMHAQVFAAKPEVLASASVLPAIAQRLGQRAFHGARIVRLDRSATPATKLVDVIFALERNPVPAVGEFVEVRLASEPQNGLSVPISSVLDAATGTFVYVLNGEHFLRTAVNTGVRSGEFIEITDGLYTGDIVVATAVEQLWLTELRLTKGGGHSH